MSDSEHWDNKVAAWLLPLADAAAPCGPDLEYDNEFLALTQAAAGKPESQFGAAEPPDWRTALDLSEALLERSRDLRIAIFWLRAALHTEGYALLPHGLALLRGLLEQHWEQLHPLPDPDDGDLYARVNALQLLREVDGLLGDLRATLIVNDRSVGQLSARLFEVALGLSPARSDEPENSKESLTQRLGAALAKTPELRGRLEAPVVELRSLMAVINGKLGNEAPDLRPIHALLQGIAGMLPAELQSAGSEEPGEAGTEGEPAAERAAARGLSGTVGSREEAMRAIDLVCAYLERAEPSNPAPLFLRRARQLINHNFLQLMRELAPDSLASVAGLVGVDPESVVPPEGADAG